MADDIAVTPGAGAAVRTKDRAGVETQVVIIDKSGGATENLGTTGAKTPFTNAPGVAPAQVLAANAGRKLAVIYNNSGAAVYLGIDGTLTTANGLPLPDGAVLVDDHSIDAWWAVTAAGAGDLRGYEVT